jgi:hypothetical protein
MRGLNNAGSFTLYGDRRKSLRAIVRDATASQYVVALDFKSELAGGAAVSHVQKADAKALIQSGERPRWCALLDEWLRRQNAPFL